MKILFISQFFPPEVSAAAARVYGLTKHLVRFGHIVDVLTAFPNHPSGIIPEEYRRRFFQSEKFNGIKVYRTYIYASPKRGIKTRFLNYISFVISSILRCMLLKHDYDVVLTTSPPLFVGISGLIASRFLRKPLVLDIRDILPEAWVNTGAFHSDSRIIKILEILELFLYKKARKIIVVTETKRKRLIQKGVPDEKLEIVTNGVDLDILIPDGRKSKSIVETLSLNGKFIVTYAGNIGMSQGIEVIIRAAEQLRQVEQIVFLIIGDGVEKTRLEQLTKELQLTNVIFLPIQPRELIPSFLALTDVTVVPLRNAEFHDVPSKLFEYMACGCPVVLSACGESREVLEQAGGGIGVEPANPILLAEAIMKLYYDSTLRTACGQNGRNYVIQHYSRDKAAQKLEGILTRLVA